MRHQLMKLGWFLQTIKDHPGINRDKINAYWKNSDIGDGLPIPRSTFFDWRNYVEYLFGVEIKCKHNREEVGYYVNPLPRSQSNIEEWFISTLNINAHISDAENLHERIQLESIPSGDKYLIPLITAMKKNHQVQIIYQKFKDQQPMTRTINPYCVKVFERRWYVTGKDIEKKDLRTFALDRILDIKILNRRFYMPKRFSISKHFQHSFGVYGGKDFKPEIIRLRAYGVMRDYLRTLAVHKSQKEMLTEEGFSDFTLKMIITHDLKQFFLSQGEQLEILEPQTLRQDIKSKITKMLALYERDRVGEVIPSLHS